MDSILLTDSKHYLLAFKEKLETLKIKSDINSNNAHNRKQKNQKVLNNFISNLLTDI